MNLVCLVYVACVSIATPGTDSRELSCVAVRTECVDVPPAVEAQMSRLCEPSPKCFEVKKGIFVLRERVPAIVETRI